ncbi:MAG: GGDEF domain-containing protein [Anaerovibrio sp.]|uniref:sensor domain-containing diguanylate cyclase n=1 Tax=Anaerovibrio sp. TaxID=1872532 RepID=UPI0025D91A27|nr:GGDEF domain-containing protein [Anaerovibrio sp.]MCR5176364.1 GGDEF domain-containing protein [Anaerovibrio sp.]
MEHIPYLCEDVNEFNLLVDEFTRILPNFGHYSSILATVFVDVKIKKDTPLLVKKLKSVLPDAKIIGGTVSANITAGVINYYGISVTFSVFKFAQVDVMPLIWEDSESRQIGKNFLEILMHTGEVAAIEMLTSGYSLEMVPFFEELSKIPSDIVFFGGVVDDGTVSGQGFVFTGDETIYRGHVVAVFKGESLHVNVGYGSGWRPLGKTMTVTKMKGFHTICEIDDIPVKNIYEKYLGTSRWDEDFLRESVVFPFSVMRNGTSLSRLPRMVETDGSASYGADFKVGDKVRLCYGNPDIIIYEARNLQQDMIRFSPEGMFAVSCWARKQILHKDVNQELEACRKSAPSTGVYAFGEYIRSNTGEIFLNNMCLSIIGMREGPVVLKPMDEIKLEPVKLERTNSVLSHMMHFVQAVSSELEESNRQLRSLAQTDFLTNLMNRGELEAEMENSLYEGKFGVRITTVLMMDIDNFKQINDTYGHDIGDSVLKSVAEIIKQSIRSTDRAGRWGGDEFIIVFNNAGADAARNVAVRIRDRIMKMDLQVVEYIITVSIGITEAVTDDTVLTLFQRVDSALYKSKKQNGKNSITIL